MLLRPWAPPAPPGPGSTRDILHPISRRPVGIARWQQPESSWLGWFSRPSFSVHETDDEPLVFTVRRLWGLTPSWEVCDADGHRVALVRPGWVWDRYGDCLAWLDRAAADALRFCGRDGRELARLSREGEGLRLEFVPELHGEPFLKMALLGAALSGMVEQT